MRFQTTKIVFFFELAKYFLSDGDAKGSYTNADATDFAECFAAACDGCTGSEDIVDEEQVTPFELLGILDTECSCDVAFAVSTAGEALLAGVTMTDKGFCVDFTIHDFSNAATQQFALVVSSFEASSPVERYRQQEVDVVKSSGVQQILSHLATHE